MPDGGIVLSPFILYNPSVTYGDSSLYTREPYVRERTGGTSGAPSPTTMIAARFFGKGLPP